MDVTNSQNTDFYDKNRKTFFIDIFTIFDGHLNIFLYMIKLIGIKDRHQIHRFINTLLSFNRASLCTFYTILFKIYTMPHLNIEMSDALDY